MRASSLAAAAVLGLAFCPPSAAQEGAEADEPKKVARVVPAVASRLDAPATAVVRIVTRAEIDALPGAHTLPDVLRTVLGVDVRSRGPGAQADVSIRGAGGSGTLVLVDGQAVNDPQSGHFSFDVDVPVAAIERIEVLAGPGSAVWGPGPIGGAVNVVTRGGDLGRAAVQLEGRYAHGTQSLDQGGVRLAVRVAEPVTVGVDWWRAETSGFADGTDAATNTLRVSGRWDTGKGPVTLGLGIAQSAFGTSWDAGLPNGRESTRTRTAALAGSLVLGTFTLTPSVSFRAHHGDDFVDAADPELAGTASDTVTGTARIAAARAALGGAIAFGAEGGRDSVSSATLGDHARGRGAVFVEFARPWDVAAPGAGGFRAGLRADAIEGYGSRVSPYAGATWRIVPALGLRASFGTAFRAPTFSELYANSPSAAGNAALEPETAWTADAGLTWAAGPLDLDAGYFHRKATDAIHFVASASDPVFRALNVGKAVTDGIETSVAWERGRPAFLSTLSLQAAWNFTDLAALSAAAGGATRSTFLLDPLHVKVDFAAGVALPLSLSLTARLSYVSRPSFTDGAWFLSSRLSWQVFEGRVLELFAESLNIGDTRVEEVPGVPPPGRTALAGFNLTW
ncbi:MAG TPA: TonB-dependent receptor [Thermoanaerobaculia bacterium]|nr:TonB-dependent receptor [Thermoanaerobaculia bacterium]